MIDRLTVDWLLHPPKHLNAQAWLGVVTVEEWDGRGGSRAPCSLGGLNAGTAVMLLCSQRQGVPFPTIAAPQP